MQKIKTIIYPWSLKIFSTSYLFFISDVENTSANQGNKVNENTCFFLSQTKYMSITKCEHKITKTSFTISGSGY